MSPSESDLMLCSLHFKLCAAAPSENELQVTMSKEGKLAGVHFGEALGT